MICILYCLKCIYLLAIVSNSLRILLLKMFIHQITPRHENSNNVVCATSKGSDQPAHTCSLIRAFASHLNIL